MAKRKVLLVEVAPKFTVRGGLFLVDYRVKGMPAFAFRPHLMLKAIGEAKSEYMDWIAEQGVIALSGHG